MTATQMLIKQVLRSLTLMVVPQYRPKRKPTKTVAVVVPLSSRPELLPEEEISLRQLNHFLGHYDKYTLSPKGLGLHLPGFINIEFSRKFFGSALAFNRLMFLPKMYELFQDYKYVLMYQLDCLVFSDDLLQWCETDYDYIGAPWVPCQDTPWVKEPRVGNGGFALMKVDSALRVLNNRYRQVPFNLWKDLLSRLFPGPAKRPQDPWNAPEPAGLTGPVKKVWKRVQHSEINWLNNDVFWGYHATTYCPEFKIPDWKTGLRFAMEAAPRHCYELNGGQLPFGCHAWGKFDRKFWESFLLPETNEIVPPGQKTHREPSPVGKG